MGQFAHTSSTPPSPPPAVSPSVAPASGSDVSDPPSLGVGPLPPSLPDVGLGDVSPSPVPLGVPPSGASPGCVASDTFDASVDVPSAWVGEPPESGSAGVLVLDSDEQAEAQSVKSKPSEDFEKERREWDIATDTVVRVCEVNRREGAIEPDGRTPDGGHTWGSDAESRSRVPCDD